MLTRPKPESKTKFRFGFPSLKHVHAEIFFIFLSEPLSHKKPGRTLSPEVCAHCETATCLAAVPFLTTSERNFATEG